MTYPNWRYFHIHIEIFGFNDHWGRLEIFSVKRYFEYNVREISVYFMFISHLFAYQGDTIWTKLQVGCEVWEFNLEVKHVRDLETLWAGHSQTSKCLRIIHEIW